MATKVAEIRNVTNGEAKVESWVRVGVREAMIVMTMIVTVVVETIQRHRRNQREKKAHCAG